MRTRFSNKTLSNAPVAQLLKILENMDLHIKDNVKEDPVKELDREFQEDHAWIEYNFKKKVAANLKIFESRIQKEGKNEGKKNASSI